MRQAGILAAGALFALDEIVPKIGEDHAKAVLFADAVSAHSLVSMERWRVQSNIVMFSTTLPDAEILQRCLERGLRIAPIKPGVLRAVFHHQISLVEAEAAAQIVTDALNQSL